MTITTSYMTECNNIAMFGEWLKGELKKKKMPQRELAGIIGVTPTHVNHMVHNRRGPSNDLIKAISLALGIPETEVFRQANVLDPIATKDKQLEEIIYIYNKLSDAGKKSALTFLRFLPNDKESAK